LGARGNVGRPPCHSPNVEPQIGLAADKHAYSALKGLVLGEGTETDDPVQAVKDVYAQGGPKDTDEFLKPIVVGGQEGRIKG
jgi:hypothetical protein